AEPAGEGDDGGPVRLLPGPAALPVVGYRADPACGGPERPRGRRVPLARPPSAREARPGTSRPRIPTGQPATRFRPAPDRVGAGKNGPFRPIGRSFSRFGLTLLQALSTLETHHAGSAGSTARTRPKGWVLLSRCLPRAAPRGTFSRRMEP